MNTKIITIDVISDVVCPWCFLGYKRLQKALEIIAPLETLIRWHPYQLDPALPPQGKDRSAYLKEKFGSTSQSDDVHRQLVSLGKADDIEFDFDAIAIAPNTLDAHRVIHWAAQAGPGIQDRVVGGLFSRYFEQGENIGDPAILVQAATESGMQGAVVARLLESDIDRDTVHSEIVMAGKIGVRGVPCFIIDSKYVVMGAQAAEVLADAIQQIADGFEPGTTEDR